MNKTLKALPILLMATNLSASDNNPVAEIDLKEHYAKHPAATPMPNEAGDFNERMPLDVLAYLSSFQDLPDLTNFLKTSKKPYEQRELVLGTHLRNKRRGVFFRLDHPQWTPWDLPNDVTIRLHQGYAEAQKETDVKKKGLMLFSAGCLGHKAAAEEFGKLWLANNKEFPKVIDLSTLSKDVSDYPLTRLNRPMASNKELEDLRKKYIEECPEEGPTIPFLTEFLEKLETMDSYNDEVKMVKLIFRGFKTLLSKGFPLDEEKAKLLPPLQRLKWKFEMNKIKDSLSVIKARTPYINFLLSPMLASDPTELARSNFEACLNNDFICVLMESLRGMYEKKMPAISGLPNGYYDILSTPAANEAIQQVRALTFVRIFLGDNDIVNIESTPHTGDNPQRNSTEDVFLEAFFYNLMKMREKTHGEVELKNPLQKL